MDPVLTAAFTKTWPGLRLEVDWALSPGVTALMGPSGSGKTTLLRCLAGLDRPEAGLVRCAGEVWQDASRGLFLGPERRRVGFVFKEFALFPHMTVWENVRYGARREAWAREMLELFGVADLRDRRPHALSAGQQQRVAMARAMAREPLLLLMDEPFSSLDPPLKRQVLAEFAGLIRRLGVTTLVVTHAPDEASTLADRLAVMAHGRLLQLGPVAEVMLAPASAEVARLVGIRNCFPAADGEPGWCVRADRLELAGPDAVGPEVVRAVVLEAVLEEGAQRLLVAGGSFEALEVRLPLSATQGRALAVGEAIALRLPPEAVHRFVRFDD